MWNTMEAGRVIGTEDMPPVSGTETAEGNNVASDGRMRGGRMKHLKIAVIITPVSNAIQILEQTHKGAEFGKDGTSFTATNGLRLASIIAPILNPSENVLYVRGTDSGSDAKIAPVETMADIKRIIEAVKEYNNYFLGEEGGKPCSIEIIG